MLFFLSVALVMMSLPSNRTGIKTEAILSPWSSSGGGGSHLLRGDVTLSQREQRPLAALLRGVDAVAAGTWIPELEKQSRKSRSWLSSGWKQGQAWLSFADTANNIGQQIKVGHWRAMSAASGKTELLVPGMC